MELELEVATQPAKVVVEEGVFNLTGVDWDAMICDGCQ